MTLEDKRQLPESPAWLKEPGNRKRLDEALESLRFRALLALRPHPRGRQAADRHRVRRHPARLRDGLRRQARPRVQQDPVVHEGPPPAAGERVPGRVLRLRRPQHRAARPDRAAFDVPGLPRQDRARHRRRGRRREGAALRPRNQAAAAAGQAASQHPQGLFQPARRQARLRPARRRGVHWRRGPVARFREKPARRRAARHVGGGLGRGRQAAGPASPTTASTWASPMRA